MTGSVILRKIKSEFKRPTPFLLLSIFGVIIFAYVFFTLLPDQTAGLGAAYSIMIILALVLSAFVDRLIVRRFKFISVVLIELIILSLIWFFVAWSNKAATLIVKTNQDHFVVVFMEGGSNLDNFRYTNAFNKELTINDKSCIVLDKSLIYLDELEIKPHAWKNYSMKSEDIYINGNRRTVNIYWTGDRNADTDKFLTCIESL